MICQRTGVLHVSVLLEKNAPSLSIALPTILQFHIPHTLLFTKRLSNQGLHHFFFPYSPPYLPYSKALSACIVSACSTEILMPGMGLGV